MVYLHSPDAPTNFVGPTSPTSLNGLQFPSRAPRLGNFHNTTGSKTSYVLLPKTPKPIKISFLIKSYQILIPRLLLFSLELCFRFTITIAFIFFIFAFASASFSLYNFLWFQLESLFTFALFTFF